MSKILFGVFSGVFVGAVIYEFINRTNPELTKKVEEFACKKNGWSVWCKSGLSSTQGSSIWF